MKFTCTQTALLRAINTCSKAVSSRTTIPILKGILIEIKDGTARLTSSDLNMSIETSFDVQNYENGSTVVPAKLFGDIIRKLPNTLINLDNTKEFGKLSINCLGSDFSIVTLPSEEFPLIGGVNSEEFVDLNKKEFKDIINKVVFSASIDEKKGLMTGCLFNLKKGSIEAVALDGFRMAVINKDTDCNFEKSVIIPSSIVGEIYKILNEDDGSDYISVLFEEKKAEFRTEDTRIISRILEGEYINYKNIIPSQFTTQFTINRSDVLNSIERASLFAKEGKINLIKISISSEGIKIESKSEEGNVKEFVGADVSGNDLVIGFNSRYIIDVLKAVNDEEVVFRMGSNTSSCIITPIEGNEFIYLVLPVRITE